MTILNEYMEQIVVGEHFVINIGVIILGILIASGIGLFIYLGIQDQDEKLWGGIIVACIVLSFVGGLGIYACGTEFTYKDVPTYEVIIDKDTDFLAFYDTYDILEQRGDIFVIREKGWESND